MFYCERNTKTTRFCQRFRGSELSPLDTAVSSWRTMRTHTPAASSPASAVVRNLSGSRSWGILSAALWIPVHPESASLFSLLA